MGLETASHIDELDPANPLAGDSVSQGDDHIRLIKTVLQTDFPNITEPMTRTAAQLNALVTTPIGAIVAWTTGTAPSLWLECDGAAISRATYADLFAVIGVIYGNGDGSTTFNLPDLRGEFIRGFDNGAGNDPDAASRTDRGDTTTGDNVGTKQADDFASHTHQQTLPGGASGTTGVNHVAGTQNAATSATGGNETRPRNVGMMWIINAGV